MRSAFDGRFTEVVANQVLACSGGRDGIPGRQDPWASHLWVEFRDNNRKTRLRLREGPHPPATAGPRKPGLRRRGTNPTNPTRAKPNFQHGDDFGTHDVSVKDERPVWWNAARLVGRGASTPRME
jgi:hypothetical protein